MALLEDGIGRTWVWAQANRVVSVAITGTLVLVFCLVVLGQVVGGGDARSYDIGVKWGRLNQHVADTFGTSNTADLEGACRSQAAMVRQFGYADLGPGEVDEQAFVEGCLSTSR